MKYKEIIEITWYDPTEVPVDLDILPHKSVDVIMQCARGKNKIINCNTIVVMYYDKQSKQWLCSVDDCTLDCNDNELLRWCYIPSQLGNDSILSYLIEGVKIQCYSHLMDEDLQLN